MKIHKSTTAQRKKQNKTKQKIKNSVIKEIIKVQK